VQSGADFDDDAGAAGEVSDNSAGKAPVSGVSCLREPELVRCGAVESALHSKPSLELRVCKPPCVGASRNQDSKWKFRFNAIHSLAIVLFRYVSLAYTWTFRLRLFARPHANLGDSVRWSADLPLRR
jgi:hypothetical protein